MNEQEPYRPTFFDMALPITKELRQMVKEYHEYHGDLSCRIVKVVRDEVGYPSLLVRAKELQRREDLLHREQRGRLYQRDCQRTDRG